MKQPAQLLSTVRVALICCAGTLPAVAAAPDVPVLAQELEKVRASGEVLAALWTRRSDSYTLQIVLRNPLSGVFGSRTLALIDGRRVVSTSNQADVAMPPNPATQISRPDAEAIKTLVGDALKPLPRTQVWLLGPDGTLILPTQRPADNSRPNATSLRNIGTAGSELLYRFLLSDGQNAVAAAVMIGDNFYIERLAPLEVDRK